MKYKVIILVTLVALALSAQQTSALTYQELQQFYLSQAKGRVLGAATTQGLVGYWNFDEGSGTTANDTSGNGNTGTLVGSPTWTTGKVGNGALQFNGNNYINIGHPAILNDLNSFTYSAWINPSRVNTNQIIVQKGDNKRYGPCSPSVDGQLCAYLGPFSGADANITTSGGQIASNQWSLFTFTYDSSTKTGSLYLNSQLAGSTTAGGTLLTSDATQNLQIGLGSLGGFSGSIDEVRVYNRAITSQEILDIYNAANGGVTPTPTPTGDVTPPSIPTSVSATAVSSSAVSLAWTASTDNIAVSGYKVYRGGIQVGTSATNSYSDTGLSASTLYYYTVSAYDAAGNNSGQSLPASATTQATSLGGFTTGMVGFWKFDEGSGTIATDSSGNGNNGNIINATWATGESGQALDLKTASSYIRIPASASLNNLSQFTYAIWVNPRNVNSPGGYAGSMMLNKAGVKFLNINNSVGNDFSANVSMSATDINLTSAANAITLNQWQLLVFTYDDTVKTGVIYDNGLSVKRGNTAGSMQSDSGGDLFIGNSPALDRATDGVIDEVRVYNKVLSAQDVADLYNSYTGAHVVPDITPPSFSAINAANVTNKEATIVWTTNKPADSKVEYGLTTAYGNSAIPTYSNNALVTSHLVDLSNLLPATSYHYHVISTDSSGNVGTSVDSVFTTGADGAFSSSFPFLNYEGAVLPTNGDKNALGVCANTYPYQYPSTAGTATVSLDRSDSKVGNQSLRLDLTNGDHVSVWWLPYNYDNCPGRIIAPDNPRGYAREYADNQTGWQFNNYDHLTFWIKSGTNGSALRTDGGENIQFGTYVRNTAVNDTLGNETGGNHYYHFLNIAPTDTWTKVVLNTHPNHQRGANGNLEWGNLLHPTGEVNSNYFDALTPFYMEYIGSPTSYPYTAKYDGFRFYKEPYAENDNQVYSIESTYVPTSNRLILTWGRNKNEDYVKHEVRYAFSNIHQIGWNSATPATNGVITPPGSGGYNQMVYDNSTLPLSGRDFVYLAIKPQNSTLFSQICLPITTAGNSVCDGADAPVIAPPVISNLVGSNTTASSTNISWTTDQPTIGQVLFGTTLSYGFTSPQDSLTTSHSFLLSNLVPSTTYHFAAVSTNGTNLTSQTADFTFTTLAALTPSPTPTPTGPPTPSPTGLPAPLPTPSGVATPPISSVGGFPQSPSSNPIVYIPALPASLSSAPAPNPSSPLPTVGIILRLINDNGTYYLIINNIKHGITNPGLLTSYGFRLSQAKLATAQDQALPSGDLLLPQDGILAKAKQDTTVWLVSGGQRRGFTTASVFKGLGFSFSQVLTITSPELSKLSQGPNLDNPNSSHPEGLDIKDKGIIYWIHNNKRYVYPNLNVYNSWRVPNDFSRVLPANTADRLLPLGDIIVGRALQ